MRLAIVGSCGLAGNAIAAQLIEDALDKYQPTVVVSGAAPGIDSMAAAAARARGIEVREYPPTVRRWDGPGGFKERNLKIAKDCDALVRIVADDSRTYGSGWTRDQAKRCGVATEEHVVPRKAKESRP